MVRETGLDSRPAGSVIRGSDSPQDCHSLPLLLQVPESLHNTKKEAMIVTASLSMVRETGLEPVRVAPHAPQTCASADSATLAYSYSIVLVFTVCLKGKADVLNKVKALNKCLYTISLRCMFVKRFSQLFYIFCAAEPAETSMMVSQRILRRMKAV